MNEPKTSDRTTRRQKLQDELELAVRHYATVRRRGGPPAVVAWTAVVGKLDALVGTDGKRDRREGR